MTRSTINWRRVALASAAGILLLFSTAGACGTAGDAGEDDDVGTTQGY